MLKELTSPMSPDSPSLAKKRAFVDTESSVLDDDDCLSVFHAKRWQVDRGCCPIKGDTYQGEGNVGPYKDLCAWLF
jgi:hypothetical protein